MKDDSYTSVVEEVSTKAAEALLSESYIQTDYEYNVSTDNLIKYLEQALGLEAEETADNRIAAFKPKCFGPGKESVGVTVRAHRTNRKIDVRCGRVYVSIYIEGDTVIGVLSKVDNALRLFCQSYTSKTTSSLVDELMHVAGFSGREDEYYLLDEKLEDGSALYAKVYRDSTEIGDSTRGTVHVIEKGWQNYSSIIYLKEKIKLCFLQLMKELED